MTFVDLYEREGLLRLDRLFLDRLAQRDAALHASLVAARGAPPAATDRAESELLIALAPHLDRFIGWLFGIEREVAALSAQHVDLTPLYVVKRQFVQRKAMHKIKAEEAERLDGAALAAQLENYMGAPLTELEYARHVTRWQENEAEHAAALDCALKYAAWAALSTAGRHKHEDGVVFKAPHKLDPQHLVPATTDVTQGYPSHSFDAARIRRREGFKLTDPGTDLVGALD
ncbi:MAG TPA: hypothetical protein VNT02_04420, partial [Burkholderiales bacterium]|nr:hypothetical protein [Burkholderiales bacterium]